MRDGLTALSFSCSPSPLGREARLLVEFLLGVEAAAPAFFFTVSTSQLAWSSLCVLFPALMTLGKTPESWSDSDFRKAESFISTPDTKVMPHLMQRTSDVPEYTDFLKKELH